MAGGMITRLPEPKKNPAPKSGVGYDFQSRRGGLHHAAHAAHAAHVTHAAATRHAAFRFVFRKFGHHGFGGDHETGDRSSVLQSSTS